MFIQTEPTPNPDTIKFIPGETVAGAVGPFDFAGVEEAGSSPLAQTVFNVDGVTRVFLGPDFLSVSKAEGSDWKHLRPMVLAAIMDHYVAGLPVLSDGGAAPQVDANATTVDDYEGETAEIVGEILELIETGAGWRRHHLPALRCRHGYRPPCHARRLRRLPIVHDDAEAGYREYAEGLCARSERGRSCTLENQQ